jgi:hypothetical protein
MADQRANELVFAHGMPAGEAHRAGHLREIFTTLVAKRGSGHRSRTPLGFNLISTDITENYWPIVHESVKPSGRRQPPVRARKAAAEERPPTLQKAHKNRYFHYNRS